MRYGFFIHEHRKTTVNDATLEPVAFAEINHQLGGTERYYEKLRPWALTQLAQCRYEAGLYCCTLCEVVGDATPGDCLLEHFIAWNGETEITPEPTRASV